jgi:hypothetical protein
MIQSVVSEFTGSALSILKLWVKIPNFTKKFRCFSANEVTDSKLTMQ